ncbi:MAG: sterol desaturase family protein [Desulfobacterales bacterium]|nr:sterol desaturase family protein [Desulfobacterales bacterium]
MKHEIFIRLIFFLTIFGAVAYWEHRSPRRSLTTSKKVRWISNLSFMIGNPVLVRLIFPILAVDTALIARQRAWGLLNIFDWPMWLEFVVGVAILDLVIYLQHVMFHAVPLLWRLHMMHHADLDFDLTTGLRFHPIEIILSMILKMAVIVALGPPVTAVLAFEALLNGMAMFNHGNITIPISIDQWLRRLVVTPDMHRVHHSVIIRETNSNFGFNLSAWDRLFGTYCAQPQKGHTGMTIGLSQFRNAKKLTLPQLLILPFTGDPGKQRSIGPGKDSNQDFF